MKHVVMGFLGVVMFLATGCNLKPAVEVDKIGNEYVQHSYSRNAWHPNWDRVTYCWKLADNGFCPKDDTRVETITQTGMEAPGQGSAKAAAGTLPIIPAMAVIPRSKTNVNQNNSVLKDSSVSTLNAGCQAGPAFQGMKPAPGCK